MLTSEEEACVVVVSFAVVSVEDVFSVVEPPKTLPVPVFSVLEPKTLLFVSLVLPAFVLRLDDNEPFVFEVDGEDLELDLAQVSKINLHFDF